MDKSNLRIGVFDSGVGGFSVLRALRAKMPSRDMIYFADQLHVPYGSRPLEEVRSFSEEITRFLIGLGAGMIVVACNTASAAALQYLRKKYYPVPFIGMEPAVKPAAEKTQTGKVGVLATPATFQGELYASVVERFASGVMLYQDTCPGLVQAIEGGDLTSNLPRSILKKALIPMLAKGIDTVVLGCTHYPLVLPLINEICGHGVRVIDPASAVARQAARLAGESEIPANCNGIHGNIDFYSSGDTGPFEQQIEKLLDERRTATQVHWLENSITFSKSS